MTHFLFTNTTNPVDAALLDGRYRVIEVLSNHSWEKTYLAQDTHRPSQPQCIIQHIQPITPTVPTYEEAIRHLFRREAMLLERLSEHPQIPQLLACFEDQQGFYLVQEYINGYPLSIELAPNQPWNPYRVVQLLLACLEPLAFVHNHGMRHGNLKPDNLLRRVSDEQLVLVNFDSLRQVHQTLLALHEQSAAVSPINQEYQAPEQRQGIVRAASDVYALGMIAIQALTGIHPLGLPRNPTTGEVLWQSHDAAIGTDLRHNLTAILNRMVTVDPHYRYQLAGEVLEDFHRIMQPVTPTQSPVMQSKAVLSPAIDLSPPDSRSNETADHLESAGATLLVGVGLGAVLSVTVGGYAMLVSPAATVDQGNQILEQATKQYQSGQLPQAISLAESIPITSQVYPSAQTAISRWRKDWKIAASIYQAMVTASRQENWLEVLQQHKKLPQITYWQDKSAALMQEATAKADTQAAQFLQQAYERAEIRDFSSAIKLLQQIPEEVSIYPKTQEKLQEYRQKQNSYAVALLQKAYDLAIMRDFSGAMLYLKQIPVGTEVYAKSQQKIQEYNEKQKIQAEVFMGKTPHQTENQGFISTTTLENQRANRPLDEAVKPNPSKYPDKPDAWSNEWLQRVNESNLNLTLTSSDAMPIGSPAYSEVREDIIESNNGKPALTETSAGLASSSFAVDLNPGNRLHTTE